MKKDRINASGIVQTIFIGCSLLGLFLLLCLACFLKGVVKLFVWVVMLAAILPTKITVLYKLEKTHFQLLDLSDTGSSLFSEEAGKLHKKLNELKEKCQKLKIARWRQNIAYWLAVN